MELCCTAFFRTSSCCFCGKMLVTTNCYQWAGLSKGRDLLEKKKKKKKPELASLDGLLLCVCFDCQNLGLLGLVKKEKGWKLWTLKKRTLGLDDQWQTGHTAARQQTRSVSECVACACSDSVDLLQGLVLLLCGSGDWKKKWFVKWLVVSISGLNFQFVYLIIFFLGQLKLNPVVGLDWLWG